MNTPEDRKEYIVRNLAKIIDTMSGMADPARFMANHLELVEAAKATIKDPLGHIKWLEAILADLEKGATVNTETVDELTYTLGLKWLSELISKLITGSVRCEAEYMSSERTLHDQCRCTAIMSVNTTSARAIENVVNSGVDSETAPDLWKQVKGMLSYHDEISRRLLSELKRENPEVFEGKSELDQTSN